MNKIFKDDNEKKAAKLTALTALIVFLLMFFYKPLEAFDPPIEYGMEVNFGTTDFGSGDDQPLEELKTQPTEDVTPEEPVEEEVTPEDPVEEVVEEPVEEVVETPVEEVTEEVITEETTEDVPVVDPVKEEPKEVPKETPKEEPKETPKEEAAPPAPPKPDQSTQDALSSVLNGPPANGNSSGNEGDDNEDGDKGDDNGDPNAPEYYTDPGNGSGGNYQLIGRLPLRRPTPKYNCNKEGRVVVAIKVDRTGKVISATPGAKGSTTTESCLLEQAKIAALKTKWQAAANAPEKQVGKIIYNFSLY
ncbi:energy transducer TonB [Pseudofulvibacter geojedonensis]|uniref:Energy transducer TonB n=1 Tax=Pseudofulvibacter geojedonensis TaxID=1123758 RepID=A0ABW3I4G9_9FLAO